MFPLLNQSARRSGLKPQQNLAARLKAAARWLLLRLGVRPSVVSTPRSPLEPEKDSVFGLSQSV